MNNEPPALMLDLSCCYGNKESYWSGLMTAIAKLYEFSISVNITHLLLLISIGGWVW